MRLTTQNERIAVLQISLRNPTVWYVKFFTRGLLLWETDLIAQKIATDTQAPVKIAKGPLCHFDRRLSEHIIYLFFTTAQFLYLFGADSMYSGTHYPLF